MLSVRIRWAATDVSVDPAITSTSTNQAALVRPASVSLLCWVNYAFTKPTSSRSHRNIKNATSGNPPHHHQHLIFSVTRNAFCGTWYICLMNNSAMNELFL